MVRVAKDQRWHVLERLVKQHGWTRGAELGVLDGKTFMHLLKRCEGLHMVGVDLWRPMPEKEDLRGAGGRSYAQHDLEGYLKRLERESAPYGARLLRMPTTEAAREFPDGYFDFAFIDADHTYEGVSADIEAWRPKVTPGGMLLGHDYNERDFPGVVRAVDERLSGVKLFADHVWGVAC